MRVDKVYIFGLLALMISACANRGVGPQGGPKDSIPPFVTEESPLNGSLNFQGKRVEVHFNEYIQLDNVVENVLISPPQQQPPIVKAIGKRVIVTFEQPLQDSTTYTIDFGPAICDFTEKNAMEGYTFSFSTGDTMDSLSVYGYVVNAADLNPVSGIVVGLHQQGKTGPDGAEPFESVPFDRVGKSDADGAFAIHNIHPGEYNVFGLLDNSRDYVYQPGESLAWQEETVTPFCTLSDSSYEYGPADIVLWYFEEDKRRLYFQRANREEAHRVQFTFSAPQGTRPTFRSLRPSEVDSTLNDSTYQDWMPYTLWQYSAQNDTITLWLTDSIAIAQDSLHLEMSYLRTDSIYELESKTDTLLLLYRAPKLSAKALESKQRQLRNRKLTIKSNAKRGFEVYDTLSISSVTPIRTIIQDSIHLFERKDTTYIPLPYTLQVADSTRMRYHIIYPYQSEHQYELRVDSAAITDIYDISCDKAKFQMILKSVEEYATLRVRLRDFNPLARIQVLDDKDKVVRELPAQPDGAYFENLAPKTYYMRLYIDSDENGKWSTGDWAKRKQPESVYYFPAKLSLKANWDFDETFDYLGTPQLESKPDALIKDASTAKKK